MQLTDEEEPDIILIFKLNHLFSLQLEASGDHFFQVVHMQLLD